MIGRTMSHLFLTVVAAAIFLVSGCVPPIDAPDSGEQVRAVEAERIEKLESKVAEAVKAASPDKIQKLEKKVDEAVKAADPDKTLGYLIANVEKLPPQKREKEREDRKKRLQEILAYLSQTPNQKDNEELSSERRKDLREHLKEILCDYSITLTLDKFAWEKIQGDRELLAELKSSFPTPQMLKNGTRLYKKKEVTLEKYNSLVRLIEEKHRAIDFSGARDRKCDLLDGKADAAYIAVTGTASPETSQTFSLVFYLVVKDVPKDADAWLVIPDGHWLGDIVEDVNIVKGGLELKKLLDGSFVHVLTKGRHNGSWRKIIRAEFSENPYIYMQEKVGNDKYADDVYVMITRTDTATILGKPRVIPVTLYRAFNLSAASSAENITMQDRKLPVPSVEIGDPPACFPLADVEETPDVRGKFRKNGVFKHIMTKELRPPWECQ